MTRIRRLVKICGLTRENDVRSVVSAGADWLGFVFHPSSPRCITAVQAAQIGADVPSHIKKVGLFVDTAAQDIRNTINIAKLDMVQLHGTETPEQVADIRAFCDCPVMKALKMAGPADIDQIAVYEEVSDYILCDAPPVGDQTGGTGRVFDWTLLKGSEFQKPWFLAGGLHEGNIAQASQMLQPSGFDVSSGVETQKGIKDTVKINAFVKAVRNLEGEHDTEHG